jgi:hypothetical protein
MTHLEYDEAQRVGLPSLIYLIDENHAIPAKDVETGPGAEKLQALKEHLRKRHVVSFFTTPEDLQARVMHDVPTQLEQLGIEVSGSFTQAEGASDSEVLKQFELLPKIFSGRQVTIEFSMGDARPAFLEDCVALGLELGATVACYVTLGNSGQTFYVYGERDIAMALLKVPKKSIVRARATTAFGHHTTVEWDEDGPVRATQMEKGLVIKEILRKEATPSQ